MQHRFRSFMVAAIAVTAFASASAAQEHDPLTMDPPSIDAAYPPAVAELSFDSFGSRLNGHIYLANGAGPHPTAVLLHGFPGNEKNLDLAQGLRRAGFNVLFFHYRGAWGSEGDYSFSHVVEDVASAVTYLRGAETAKQYRIDTNRISLVGHSMGGFAAVMAGAADPSITCVTGIAAANLGPRASATEAELAGFAAYLDAQGMLNHKGSEAVIAEIAERGAAFDTTLLGPKFSGRPVLLVAGKQDSAVDPTKFHLPQVEAYTAAGVKLTHVLMEGDHSFSWTRFALMRTVTDWMGTNCR